MGSPRIDATHQRIAPDCEFGDDVAIEADEVDIGPGCRIGFSDGEDFRTVPGVRIQARHLVLGAGVQIGRSVRIEGGDLRLESGTRVMRHATIRVLDRLRLGAHGTVGEGCEISGRDVTIGQELWMLPRARIGGGSAFELPSRLTAGHYLHIGLESMINTARPVVIGHEVGLGTRTNIYTHGAYPDQLHGFPGALAGVEIGDFTWIPGATVNPGVRIGRMCVVGVNSLVTKSLPDGCLAAGSPAKVIRENAYPQPFDVARLTGFFGEFLERYRIILGRDRAVETDADRVLLGGDRGAIVYVALPVADAAAVARLEAGDRPRAILVGPGVAALDTPDTWTRLDTVSRRIAGPADPASDRFVNELRRYGIRFYSRAQGDQYADWEVTPPTFDGISPAMNPEA